MKSFLNQSGLLNEADTQASTDAEELFVDLWNFFTGKGKGMSKDQFLDTPWESDPNLKKAYGYFRKYGGAEVAPSNRTKLRLPADEAEVSDLFYDLGQTLLKKGKGWGSSPNAVPAGSTKPGVSGYWKDSTGKAKDTSKSDIIIGGQGISVKNGGGARLMSGVEAEAKATIETAVKQSGADKKVQKELEKLLKGFVEPLVVRQNDIPGLAAKSPALRDFAKVIKDPEQRKKLNAQNQKAMELFLQGDAMRASEKTQQILNKHFNASDSAFAKAWSWEAGSGAEKFSGKVFGKAGATEGEATWMFAFSPDLTKIVIDRMDSPSSPIVKKIASQAQIRFDFKSNSGKYGRRGYQTMQAELKTDFTKVESLTESVYEEADKWNNMLNESLITEAQLLKKLLGLAKKMLDGMKRLWEGIKKKVKKIADAFAKALKQGYRAVLEFLEIEMVNPRVKTEFDLL
tara:strand:+ start:329 stop:1699 length:1371 start_codon:yes stop_codon:yes gene_type:complete